MSNVKVMNYAQAVNAAIEDALTQFPKVILFGEDVALPGGVHGVTKGLHRKFGDRVFDTPISESAILGGAVGAALTGLRPIAEIMWADFSLVALDQIVNQAANVRYISKGALQAPLTIRTQQGSSPGSCAQHSQSLEAIFAHIPGLEVAMPSNPQAAYDLMRAAVRSNDPTIVIDNRTLYFESKEPVDLDAAVPQIGDSVVRRSGRSLTIVSWGAMLDKVLDAVTEVETDLGRDDVCDVVETRWLRPLDLDAVTASVRKTGRLLVVHEAHTIGGLGAEIVAGTMERGVELTMPPVRIGARAARIPAAPSLQEAVIPQVRDIVTGIMSLLPE